MMNDETDPIDTFMREAIFYLLGPAHLAPPIAGGLLLGSLPFAASAVYGYSKTSDCQRINEQPVPKNPTI
jgi:hypothetical protein